MNFNQGRQPPARQLNQAQATRHQQMAHTNSAQDQINRALRQENEQLKRSLAELNARLNSFINGQNSQAPKQREYSSQQPKVQEAAPQPLAPNPPVPEKEKDNIEMEEQPCAENNTEPETGEADRSCGPAPKRRALEGARERRINMRLDRLEERQNQREAKIDRLDQGVGALEQRVGALEQKKTKQIAGDNINIIAGDFNAQHKLWGYPEINEKGKHLLDDMTEMGYQLINDLETTTRNALTSTQRDTNPDLTFLGETTRPLRAKWRNTEETLGSDHKILEIVIPFRGNIKESRQQHIVDWHDYRQKLESNGPETIEDIEAWANLLNGTIQSATQTVNAEAEAQNGRLATNVTIKWFPAHAGKLDESVGPNRNEEADRRRTR
ncbi:hypothetical protein MTO96_041669 [Rhipicephalus appendiculatus]